jgi:hypothetical protein
MACQCIDQKMRAKGGMKEEEEKITHTFKGQKLL